MISFQPFRQWFVSDPTRKKLDLINSAGINSRTMANLWRDGNVTTDTIDKICAYYKIPVERVIEYVPTDENHNNEKKPNS